MCCAAKNIPALRDRRAAVAERRAGAHPDLGRRRVLAHGLEAQQAHGAFCGGHGAVVLQELDLVELRVAAGGLCRVRLVEFRDDAGVALEGVPEHVADADAAHADLPPEVAFEDPHDVVVGGDEPAVVGTTLRVPLAAHVLMRVAGAERKAPAALLIGAAAARCVLVDAELVDERGDAWHGSLLFGCRPARLHQLVHLQRRAERRTGLGTEKKWQANAAENAAGTRFPDTRRTHRV
jgi:hypothetical protein